MQKRHEQSIASTLMRLVSGTSLPQRLKDLSETDEEDDRFVQVHLQKRKVAAMATPAPKRVNKVQKAPEPREHIIPSAIPRGIKTRATKANPKIGEKE